MQNPEQQPMETETPQPAPNMAPVVGMTPPVAPKPKSKAKLFIVLGLILAIIAGALLYFFVFKATDDGGAPPSLSLESSGLQGFIDLKDVPIKMVIDGETYEVDGDFLGVAESDLNTDPTDLVQAAELASLKLLGAPLDVASGTMIYFPEDAVRGDVLERAAITAGNVGDMGYTVTWEPSASDADFTKAFHVMPPSVFKSVGVTETTVKSPVSAGTIQALYFAKPNVDDPKTLRGTTLEIYGALDGSTEPSFFSFDKDTALPSTWYLVTAPHADLENLVTTCKDEIKTVWNQTGLRFGQFERADLNNFAVNPNFYFAWIKTDSDYDGCKDLVEIAPTEPSLVDPSDEPPKPLEIVPVDDSALELVDPSDDSTPKPKPTEPSLDDPALVGPTDSSDEPAESGTTLTIPENLSRPATTEPDTTGFAPVPKPLEVAPADDGLLGETIPEPLEVVPAEKPADSGTTLTIPGDLSGPTTTAPDTSTDLSNDPDTSGFTLTPSEDPISIDPVELATFVETLGAGDDLPALSAESALFACGADILCTEAIVVQYSFLEDSWKICEPTANPGICLIMEGF